MSSFSEETKFDFVAKTAHTVQMIDFLKYKRTIEGPQVMQNYVVEKKQSAQPRPTTEDASKTLKYISRKEKATRLIAKSPVFQQPASVTNELERIPVKSPVQQKITIPEEQMPDTGYEQPFVSDFLMDSPKSDVPQRMTIKMEKLSPEDKLRKEFTVSKTRQLAAQTQVQNDPYYEEKTYVKKNFDLYRHSPEKLSPQKKDVHRTTEENALMESVPGMFGVAKEAIEEGEEELEESFMARLNAKYKSAYLEANAKKQIPKKKIGQGSASGAKLVQEIPFVHDDTLRESHLINSLISPHATDLAHINQRTGLLSGSRDLRSKEGTLQTDQYDVSGTPQKGSSKKQQESRRGRREDTDEAKRRRESPSKRGIPMNQLFDQFEQDFLRMRDQHFEEADREQTEAREQSQMEFGGGSGQKRGVELKKYSVK